MNRYESYKNSEIDWVGEIPSHWETAKPKHKLKRVTRPIDDEDEVVTCFRDGVVTLRKNRREDGFTNSIKEHGYQQIRQGDLVVHEMDGFEGAIGISDSKGKSTPVYTVVEPDHRVDLRYISYLLREMSKTGKIESLARSIRERTTDFRWNMWSVIHFPFPPTEEQKLISRYLDKKTEQIDRLVEKIQKKIELLKEQRTSLINQCVTKGLDPNVEMKDSDVEWIGEIPKHWDIKKISWVTSLVTQGGNPDYSLGEVSDDFRVLKTKNLYDDKIYYDSADTISEATFLRETQSKPEPNDLLVAIVGKGSIGKVNIFDPPDDRKYIYSRSLGCVRFIKDEINVFYIKWFFNSSSGKQILNLGIGGSTGQEVLKTTYLSGLLVPKPPLTEQKKISYYLKTECSKIDQMVDIETKRSNLLKEYCQSLISSVVTGKVHVTKDML